MTALLPFTGCTRTLNALAAVNEGAPAGGLIVPPRARTIGEGDKMQLDQHGATVKGPEATFTGDVYVTPVHGAEPPSRLTVGLVRFTPGARSFWHHHGLGQLLVCTEGFGFVATRDGSVIRLRAGESVWTPPGEEHWHGATEGTLMCHYAMVEAPEDGTEATTWLEAVTEQQYQAAHRAGG